MFWSHPLVLIGLLASPVLFHLVYRYEKKRYDFVLNAFSKEMQVRLFSPKSKSLATIKGACLLASLLTFVLFLAGPKSSKIQNVTTKALGRDVFILFDVSESMNAEDVAPNRLTVAKLDVEDLLNAALGDRIGLVAFAGSAQVEVPLTSDREFFRTLLRKIDTTTVRMGGTAIGDAIRLALERFGTNEENRSRVIVLITDGEDHESLPLEAARNAAEANVPIVTVAIGDTQGAKIPIVDASGRKSFKTYDGEPVISKPSVEELKEIAKISGGRYYYADSTLDLAEVYKTSIDTLARSEINDASQVQLKDLYQPFLAAALLMFALYYFLPSRLPNKRKNSPSFYASTLIIATSFFLSNICVGNDIPSQNSVDGSAEKKTDVVSNIVSTQKKDNITKSESAADPKNKTAQSADAIKTNEKKDSISVSKNASKEYNRAIKLLDEGKEDEATAVLTQLLESDNKEVKARSNYNLGVVALKRALELSQQLTKEPEINEKNNDVQASADQNAILTQNPQGNLVQTLGPNSKNEAPSGDEIVKRYNAERQKRQELRQELDQEVQKAKQCFSKGKQSKRITKTADENAEALALWNVQKHNSEKERERSLREEALPSAELQLLWLENETQDYIQSLETNGDSNPNGNFYQNLFTKRAELPELDRVLERITEDYSTRLQESGVVMQSYSPQSSLGNGQFPSSPSVSQPPDVEGAKKIESLEIEFKRSNAESIASLSEYDADKARNSLRRAQVQLSTIRDITSPYETIVLRSATDEQKAEKNNTEESLTSRSKQDIESYYWNRTALKNAIDEFERKAELIVKIVPEPENSSINDLLDSSNSETTTSDEQTQSNASQHYIDDDPVKAETDANVEKLDDSVQKQEEDWVAEELNKNEDVESNENSSAAPQRLGEKSEKTQEEKILESSKIALRYKDELDALTQSVLDSLGSDEKQAQELEPKKARDLVEKQTRIAKILQEIARPLQDNSQQDQQNNDQDQNDQNQDKNKQDQQKNQQDQNKQKDDKDQDRQDQSDRQKQDQKEEEQQDEKAEKEQKDKEQDKEQNEEEKSKDDRQRQDANSSENKAKRPKLSEDEQKAESMIRQVERRQKDAEEQRRMLQQLLKRREKAGKDW